MPIEDITIELGNASDSAHDISSYSVGKLVFITGYVKLKTRGATDRSVLFTINKPAKHFVAVPLIPIFNQSSLTAQIDANDNALKLINCDNSTHVTDTWVYFNFGYIAAS